MCNKISVCYQEGIFKISTLRTFKFKKLRLYDIHQELKARRLVSSSWRYLKANAFSHSTTFLGRFISAQKQFFRIINWLLFLSIIFSIIRFFVLMKQNVKNQCSSCFYYHTFSSMKGNQQRWDLMYVYSNNDELWRIISL